MRASVLVRSIMKRGERPPSKGRGAPTRTRTTDVLRANSQMDTQATTLQRTPFDAQPLSNVALRPHSERRTPRVPPRRSPGPRASSAEFISARSTPRTSKVIGAPGAAHAALRATRGRPARGHEAFSPCARLCYPRALLLAVLKAWLLPSSWLGPAHHADAHPPTGISPQSSQTWSDPRERQHGNGPCSKLVDRQRSVSPIGRVHTLW